MNNFNYISQKKNNIFNDYSEFANIALCDIRDLISLTELKFFSENGIFTLEQLFRLSEQPNFIEVIDQNVQSNFYKEIIGTIRVLRCKYLKEEPLIDFSKNFAEIDDRQDIMDTFLSIGLSTRAANALRRTGFNLDDLFDIIRNSQFSKISTIRSIGENSVNEIIAKTSVIVNYYEQKEKDPDSLESLLEELQRLRIERDKVVEQIRIVEEKIETKNNASKGGFSR